MSDERAVMLGRAVSSTACRVGVALKDRRPALGDVEGLLLLAGQCLDLAAHLDTERASEWASLSSDMADAARRPQPATGQRRRSAA